MNRHSSYARGAKAVKRPAPYSHVSSVSGQGRTHCPFERKPAKWSTISVLHRQACPRRKPNQDEIAGPDVRTFNPRRMPMSTQAASQQTTEFPYFTEEHDLIRQTVMRFCKEDIAPFAAEWDEKGIFPRELFKKAGDLGLFGIRIDPRYGGRRSDELPPIRPFS